MNRPRQDWGTPWWLFDELNREFKFTIDVCADARNAKMPIYFDKKTDGLRQKWTGRVFMNPPYARGEIEKWTEKAAKSGTLVVALLPASTGSRWFHDWVYGKAEIRFLRDRIYYDDGPGRPRWASIIAIWRPTGSRARTSPA